MESMSVAPLSTMSEKQNELLQKFITILKAYKINVRLNTQDCGIGYPLALDVEHDEQGNMVCIGVYDGTEANIYTAVSPFLKATLENLNCTIIAHNGKGDMDSLRQWGINVRDEQLIWDTMLIGHIIDSSLHSYGLKDMAKRELSIDYPDYDAIVGKRTAKQSTPRITLDQQPIELVAAYNAMDCYATYQLYLKQYNSEFASAANCTAYFRDLEKPASLVFTKMENRGICVDLEYLRSLQTTLVTKQSPIISEIVAELGQINLNSPKQLLEALNAKGIYPKLKNKSSTDKRALAALADNRIVSNLLKYSELDTLLCSFVNPYIQRNQEVVRPFFNQCGTRTGRPSCSNPNLLQIPQRTENGKLVRRMFVPRPGSSLLDCDYGQIEPRVLAHLSGDPALCDLFNNEIDFHTYTAERLGISRDRAKILNLSVGYRATFVSVMSQLGCDKNEAQTQIDRWWALFPTLRRWQDRLIYETKRSQYCTTLLGRRIKVDGLSNGNKWQREAAERQLINNITQGSAAEIMKRAMIDIDAGLPTIGLLCQIYDELLIEVPTVHVDVVRDYVVDKMANAVKLKVPLTVDSGIGADWSSAKEGNE